MNNENKEKKEYPKCRGCLLPLEGGRGNIHTGWCEGCTREEERETGRRYF